MIFTSLRADGTESTKFASLPGFPCWPRWSPDGSRLSISMFDSKTGSYSLWEIQADGSHPHPIMPGWNNPSQECCGSWTLDGKYFVFESNREGKTEIWAMAEKGGLFRKTRPRTHPVDHRTTELFPRCSQRRWKENFCRRFSAPWRARTF